MKFSTVFLMTLLVSGNLLAQEPDPFKAKKPKSERIIEPKSDARDEEVYSPDGTYQKTVKGIVTKGHHINKVFHGEFIEKGPLHTISRTYDHGNLVGYENGKLTHDNNPPDKHEYWKKGPYFAGNRSSGFFTISTYDRNFFLNYGFMMLRQDTLFFSPNKDIEIRRHVSAKGQSRLNMDSGTLIYRIYGTKKPSYSIADIEAALKTKTYGTKHFLVTEFNQEGEVIQFNQEGKRVAASYPDYRLTYHPDGTVKDSICRTSPYELYHFDTAKKLVFKIQTRIAFEAGKDPKTYSYFKGEQLLYSISFVENMATKKRALTIKSSNDSINQMLTSGVFRDYQGTYYITQADGRIDTSFSEAVYPFRYQNKLKNGNYYFLPNTASGLTRVISVTDTTIETYRSNPREGKSWNHYFVNGIMQNGNRYLFAGEYRSYTNADRIVINNGLVYSSDWIDETTRQRYDTVSDQTYTIDQLVNWELFPNNLDDLVRDFAADTLFSFTTRLLTESEYKKAWKSKSITKMSRTEFDRLIHELKEIRKKEDEALAKVRANGAKEIFIDSRQLSQLVYNMGYNPYFIREEMTELMTSFKLTAEEQASLERLMFIYHFER